MPGAHLRTVFFVCADAPIAIPDVDAMAPNITNCRLDFPDFHCVRHTFTLLLEAGAD